MIKIILADDHSIVRNGIRNLLEKENIEVLGEAVNGEEILKLLNTIKPDILLADMNMPGIDIFDLLEKVKSNYPDVKVMLLTAHDHQQYVNQAFQSGADAYLFKKITTEELIFAITHVYSGRKYVCAELSMRLLDRVIASPQLNDLTGNKTSIQFSEREKSILTLIANGYTNEEIADRLFTSKRTVEGYRQAMINKAGVRNTPALIKFALQHGLID